jgi:hypothetical protein
MSGEGDAFAVARYRSHPTVDQEYTVARIRRSLLPIAAGAVAAAIAFGVGGAIAQDGKATGSDPDALLERLAVLETDLPGEVAPNGVDLDPETSFGVFAGDATSQRAMLDLLEPELRALFIDADDADGEVATAIGLIAQGWLDVWTGSAAMATAESNDLAFPTTATDELGVAAGADALRGSTETGLQLILQGRARHLEGYQALRKLNAAEPSGQVLFDDRARQARVFDEEVRPELAAALSEPSPSILVPTERFVTDAPGVRSRATSLSLACVDRDLYEAAMDLPEEERQVALADVEVARDDCEPAVED